MGCPSVRHNESRNTVNHRVPHGFCGYDRRRVDAYCAATHYCHVSKDHTNETHNTYNLHPYFDDFVDVQTCDDDRITSAQENEVATAYKVFLLNVNMKNTLTYFVK